MEKQQNRFFAVLPAWLSVLAGCMLTGILLLLAFGQPALDAYYQNRALLPNGVLWAFALAIIALLLLGRAKQTEHATAKNGGTWRLAALFLLVLAVQFIIVRCAWYTIGWDAGMACTTAEELARGLAPSDPAYYALCPNNAPLTVLLSLPLWVAVQLGLSVPFVVLPYLDAVLLNLSAYLCVQCVRVLTKSRFARGFALVIAIGWIALSPFMLYPYTDTWSILFPVSALLVYLRVRRPALKWFLVSFFSFFGAAIKPTALIFLIALLLLSVCRFLAARDFSPAVCKRAAIVLAALFIGMLPGRLFQSEATKFLTGSARPEGQLSATHYLMLGMNGETKGGHSPADVEYSLSFPTLSQRQSGNLQRAWQRVSERTVGQNASFFATKAYKAYNDGSFAAHTSFLEMEIPKRTDALSAFVRSFYHARGSMSRHMHTLVQCLWLGLLTLCGYTAITRRHSGAVALLSLTLLGLTAYLLLFEVWPRYLFLYAPFFVILAALAFDRPIGKAARN